MNSHSIGRGRRVAALAALAMVAACSRGGDGARPQGAAPAAAATASDVEAAALSLEQGDVGAAKKRLRGLLKRDPMNASARMLLDSIDGDPREQLGPISHPYTVKPGETMRSLAARFLGNPLKSYQLARYNGIATPAALTTGQMLRIPGAAPRPVPPPTQRAEPRAAPAPAPSARPKPAPARPPAAAAPAPARPAANPAAAARARGQGLAALNAGRVQDAVVLLRRAAALDPGNPAIARDLGRAQRIAATVRQKR